MPKIAILDIETGGFRTADPIFEVGIVSLNLETGEKETLYDKLVCEKDKLKEEHAKAWIFSNSTLKYEDVLKADPLDIEAIQKILDQYSITAYNKAFDLRFFRGRDLKASELDCPMLLATDVCKLKGKFGKFKRPKVEEAWKHFFPGKLYIELHRGADDALHEADIVYALYKMGIFKVPEALEEAAV